MNGYANTFYGWGGEDDDLHHRIQQLNLGPIQRNSVSAENFSDKFSSTKYWTNWTQKQTL
jgi:hypothetical protein